MTWICSLLLVLGLVLTSTNAQATSNSSDAITSDQSTTDKSLNTATDKDSEHGGSVSVDEAKANLSVMPSRDTAGVEPGMNSTAQAFTTKSSSVASRNTIRLPSTTTTPPASPSPARTITSKSPSTRTASTTTRADTTKNSGLITPNSKTGPIIVIVIIIAVVLLGGICYFTRKKSRSVDIHPRQDEVQIPLNTGGLEEAADTASQNGISSFAHKDTDVHMESEAEAGNKTEQEGGKAGADKPDGEPPAPSPTPASSVDQLAEGGPSEAAPLAPVDQAPVENAPVEQAPMQQKVNEPTESIQTSEETPVEPAKETNDNNNSNNNNNVGIGVAGWSLDILEPLLDSPV